MARRSRRKPYVHKAWVIQLQWELPGYDGVNQSAPPPCSYGGSGRYVGERGVQEDSTVGRLVPALPHGLGGHRLQAGLPDGQL